MTRFPQADVAVVGLGPAGRALTHRLVERGARVVAIDPTPERRWWQTYAGWQWQLPAWLDEQVVGAHCGRPVVRAPATRALADEYVVLDTGALQRSLGLGDAQLVRGLVDDAELGLLAPVVVDCRGSHPLRAGSPASRRHRERRIPVQTAHGVKLTVEQAAPLLDGAEAVLMDWRPFDGSARWGDRRASFCYVIPLPDGRVLVEETSLAAAPAMGLAQLQHRLAMRLRRHGVPTHVAAAAEHERVWIPLQASARRESTAGGGVHRFGAAGAQLNPVSGYSVFASLSAADEMAARLLDGPAASTSPVPDPRRLALGALERLGGDATAELFAAFSRLPADCQRSVLDPTAPPPQVVRAMGRQWWAMSARHQPALVAATAAGLRAPRPRLAVPRPITARIRGSRRDG